MSSYFTLKMLIAVICGGIAAMIASHKGRNAAGWFFGGFFLQLIGIIIVAVLPNLNDKKAERERLERENRLLRERLHQEQVKSEAFRQHATKRLDLHDESLGIDTREAAPPLPTPEDELLALPGVATAEAGQNGETAGASSGEVKRGLMAQVLQPGRSWHYEANGGTIGPIPEEELIHKFQAGELDASTLVWSYDLDDWKAADQVPALKPFVMS